MGWVEFFEETFLVADISKEIILEMSFFSFSKANIQFTETKKLTLRNYTVATALPTINRIIFIDKKKFPAVALNIKAKIFVINITTLLAISTYLSKKAQIKGLLAKEAFIKVIAKYLDYINVFPPDLTIELLEHIVINNYTINYMKKKTTILWLNLQFGFSTIRNVKGLYWNLFEDLVYLFF